MSYNPTISACSKGLQWERELQLLEALRRQRFEPNVVSYNAAISAYAKWQRSERALQLLAGMSRQRMEPDVTSCERRR